MNYPAVVGQFFTTQYTFTGMQFQHVTYISMQWSSIARQCEVYVHDNYSGVLAVAKDLALALLDTCL